MNNVNLGLGLLQLDAYAADEVIEVKEGSNHDIAIIGMATKFPLAETPEEFWENIKNGIDCMRELPEERRQDADQYLRYKDPDMNDVRYLKCAYLDDVDKFDPEFFSLTPQEAKLMSPVHRLVLETAWEAVEDAGYGGDQLSGTPTGVFLGFIGDLEGYKYKEIIETVDPDSLPLSVAGNLASMISGRIAYVLNLKGPSVLIDTACSSSLVAVDQACRAIRTGACDMAIAGGVRLTLLPLDKDNQKIGIESEDCSTRAFDEHSSGSGLGEGLGVVLLKPLEKAIRDRDSIYAVIRGSAVNQDGTSMGITAPNPAAHEAVIVKAWEDAGIHPETLSHIEVHGTGTKLGDTIEMNGLRGAFKRYTDRTQFCAISSVKTNIGHLYESAGIAGLAKSVMALQHKQIPPSLHFHEPNHKIDFAESPVYVNNKLREWEASDTPRRCAISSFGISGTNCHLVLEEAPPSPPSGSDQGPWVLPLSARNKETLLDLIGRYAQAVTKQAVSLTDLCFTAGTGRKHHQHRVALVVTDLHELQQLLALVVSDSWESAGARAFYGTHRVIADDRDERQRGEITDQERDVLSREAGELLRTAKQADRTEAHMERLCQLYVQGADIDWHELYRSGRPKRVHLPTYPFKRKRCWVDIPDKPADGKKADSFYNMVWKAEPRPSHVMREDAGPVVVFKDRQGLSEQLIKRYREIGRDVVEVELGEAFCKRDDHRFVIAGTESDYAQLVAELKGIAFEKVLHLFSIREKLGVATFEELEQSQQHGVYSLFHFTRALARSGVDRKLDIVLFAENASAVTGMELNLQPENVTLFGLGKVIRKELASCVCRAIDFDEHTSLEDIWAELNTNTGLYKVAYRASRRYVEQFSEVALQNIAERSFEIKEGGVYLITGGTGGIGLEVARWISRQKQVNLVLLNRSKMPERASWEAILAAGQDAKHISKIRDLLEIETNGATVSCMSVDVTHRDELQAALQQVRETYGRINGVIHSAGVGSAEEVVTRDLADFQAVFNPKVQGTWNLDQLTREDNLDFMVLFSSIATMFSAPGQGDYTAANSYLDSYAAYRSKKGHATLTINWSTWRERGMAADIGFAIDTLFKTISSEDAIEGFETVLNRNLTGVLIGEINYQWERIETLKDYHFKLSANILKNLDRHRKTATRTKTRPVAKEGPVKLTGRNQGQYSEIEQRIAEICKETLGLEEINVHDSFFELGVDSILLKKMQTEMDKVYPGKVAVADVFAYPTIAKLSQFIGEDGAPKQPVKEKKDVSVHLEQDVNKLLDQMEHGDISMDQLLDKLNVL